MMEWEDLPPFDKLSTCVKCGYKIQEPVAPPPPPPEPKPAAKATTPAKKESAAAATNPSTLVMPVTAPNPTVAYCNGEMCPWVEPAEVVPEHMHQFCDCCGYEWVSKPLG